MRPMRYLYTLLLLFIVCAATLNAQAQSERTYSAPHGHDDDVDHIRCGTMLYAQQIQQMMAASGDEFEEKSKGTSTQSISQIYARPVNLEVSFVSSEGHFLIHYTRNGSNAPDLRDLNGNGHPDFMDSVDYYLENAWRVEIDSCHFATPPPDNPNPGSGGQDGRIDVYVSNLANNVYGLAFPDTEGKLSATRTSSYLLLDNDYDPQVYSTPGIEGLKVTIAHEFFHVVQLAGYYDDLSQASIFEATAVYMEYKLHPDVRDYRNYFRRFLTMPQEFPMSTNDVLADGIIGYAHMHYIYTIRQLAGEEIIKSIWEEFARSGLSFSAIDAALVKSDNGLNLTNTYCRFANWSYLTGDRAGDTNYLPEADKYPLMEPALIRTLHTDEEVFVADSLAPLAFGIWRLIVERPNSSDTYSVDFLITNGRSNIGAGGSFLRRNPDGFTLSVRRTEAPDYSPIFFRSDTLYYRLDSPHTDFCVNVYFDGGVGTIITPRPTPQPFLVDGANNMIFNVNLDQSEVSKVDVRIYSVSMAHVVDLSTDQLQNLEGVQGILWDGRDKSGRLVPTGIYIYSLSVNESEPVVGKLAIVRK